MIIPYKAVNIGFIVVYGMITEPLSAYFSYQLLAVVVYIITLVSGLSVYFVNF